MRNKRVFVNQNLKKNSLHPKPQRAVKINKDPVKLWNKGRPCETDFAQSAPSLSATLPHSTCAAATAAYLSYSSNFSQCCILLILPILRTMLHNSHTSLNNWWVGLHKPLLQFLPHLEACWHYADHGPNLVVLNIIPFSSMCVGAKHQAPPTLQPAVWWFNKAGFLWLKYFAP